MAQEDGFGLRIPLYAMANFDLSIRLYPATQNPDIVMSLWFTSDEAVEKWVNTMKLKNYSGLTMPSWNAALKKAEEAKKFGGNHVVVNPAPGKMLPRPVDELIAEIQSNIPTGQVGEN